MNRDVLQKIIRIIKLLRTHDNDQEAEKFEMVSALEAELAKPEIDYPPECTMPEMELAYAAGWWKALEVQRNKQHPLDKKADNARDLGLDYEPEQDSISTNDHLCAMLRQVHDVLACTALPMKRPWVGLTDEEILSAAKEVPITCIRQRDYDLHFAPIIEAKLKEKNGGV
jgi:hypothetical protein